ncbi:hypothetical protein [Streptomyces sp. NPDC055006]
MATYRLMNGYSVQTKSYDTSTEFTTIDPGGDVISTVYASDEDEALMLEALRMTEALAGA